MKTFEESFEEILRHVTYSPGGRDILMAHQFVVNQGLLPELSDSETRVSVGGTDQVEAALFQPFCYTARGISTAVSRSGRIRYTTVARR